MRPNAVSVSNFWKKLLYFFFVLHATSCKDNLEIHSRTLLCYMAWTGEDTSVSGENLNKYQKYEI